MEMKRNAETNYVAPLPSVPFSPQREFPTFYMPSPQYMPHNVGQPLTQPVAPQKEESSGFWTFVGLGALAIGAVIVGAAIAALSERESEATPSTKTKASPQPEDQWVGLADGDIIAMNFHVESREVNLWNLYQTNRELLEAELQDELRGCFDPDMEIAIVFQEGSVWAKMIVRVKTAWDSLGNRISTTAQNIKRQLNISEIVRKLQLAFKNFVAKTKQVVSSPVVKGTYKVFTNLVTLASGVTSILNYIDPEHKTALATMLTDWAGNI
jgi:hypothetical protein